LSINGVFLMARNNNWNMTDAGRFIIVGCTLIGLGIGVATGNSAAGLLIGGGVGVLTAVVFPNIRV